MRGQTVVFPGSFDPITLGHVDLIERTCQLFDHVVVGIALNRNKTACFDIQTRCQMATQALKHLSQVEVKSFEGLLATFAQTQHARAIIRGVRGLRDMEYEVEMAYGNQHLCPNIQSLFLPATGKYSSLSSSLVKEIAAYGGNISQWVPQEVAIALTEKFKQVG